MLEAYFGQLDASAQRLAALKKYVDDAQDYVNIDLDARRNRILEITVLIGFAVIVHACASCVYGIFGMNLVLPYYPDPATPIPDAHAFNEVASITACVGVLLWLLIVAVAKRKRLLHYVV